MTDPIRERLPMQVHDLGCRCWPHVSESEAVAVITDVALKSYRDEKRAADERDAARADAERLAEALRDAIDVAHETDSLRSHSDDERKNGWFRAPLYRCTDATCEEATAALRAHEEATK